MSDVLAWLGSLGAHVLQQSEGPAEQTLCFSVVPVALALAYFTLRLRRQRWQAGDGAD